MGFLWAIYNATHGTAETARGPVVHASPLNLQCRQIIYQGKMSVKFQERGDPVSSFWSDMVAEPQPGDEPPAGDMPPAVKAPEQVASRPTAPTPVPSALGGKGAWFVLSMFALPLLTLIISTALPSFDGEDSNCLGTGEVWVHNQAECQERIYGQFNGEVGNQTVEGKEYRIYEWEMVQYNSDRDDDWIRSAVYARVDFRTTDSYVRGHYYAWFECPGLFECVTHIDFDNKSWTAVTAQQIDHGGGAYSNSTRMFVNIEEGGPFSIAFERDVELSSRSDLVIELVH